MKNYSINNILGDDFVPNKEDLEKKHEKDSLWAQVQKDNPDLSLEKYAKAKGVFRRIRNIYSTRNRKGYELSDLMRRFHDQDMWKNLGFKSFNQFVSDPDCPFGRSSAYRYVKVGSFMNELDVASQDFEEKFYKEHNVDRIDVLNEDGTLNKKETEVANSLPSRVRFMDMSKIAGVYNDGHVGAAGARKLMAQSILMTHDDFKLEIREVKGEENPTDPDEELFREGLKGKNITIPLGAGTKDDLRKAKKYTEKVLDDLEDNNIEDDLADISAGNAVEIGKKSTSHVKIGNRYYNIP